MAPSKAAAAATAVKSGTGKKMVKRRTRVHFYKPKSFKPAKDPKYPSKSTPTLPAMDKYRVIKYPLTTESAMKKIEDNNTLVFIVDARGGAGRLGARRGRAVRFCVARTFERSRSRYGTRVGGAVSCGALSGDRA